MPIDEFRIAREREKDELCNANTGSETKDENKIVYPENANVPPYFHSCSGKLMYTRIADNK